MESGATGIEALSERQKEVLRLMARHLQAKEVALILKISRHTVDTHTEEARRRLGVATSREAARLLSDYEKSLPENQGPLSSGMAEAASGVVSTDHENAQDQRDGDDESGSERRLHGREVAGSGIGVAHAGDTREAAAHRRHFGSGEAAEPGRTRQGGVHHGSGDGLADGRGGRLTARLARLTPLQCVGLLVGLAIAMAFALVALLACAAATIDVLKTITGRAF